MDEGREKHVRAKPSCDGDRLSNLPDSLLHQVLLNLGTKDVVRTSSLSPRWRDLWKDVPNLKLDYEDFPDYYTFVGFVDSFLGFNRESPLQSFKVTYHFDGYIDEREVADTRRWINSAIKRKVKHIKQIDVLEHMSCIDDADGQIPESIYTCESLVSLKLCGLSVDSPEFVSLPSLKVISLERVEFPDDSDFEMLILGCPVLERLSICRRLSCDIGQVRVCSLSLVSFSLLVEPMEFNEDWGEDSVVTIDAPRLENLTLDDHRTASFIVQNCGSLAKVDIDITFNLVSGDDFDPEDLPKRKMIYEFLLGISSVKDMVLSSDTLEIIHVYSRNDPVPVFQNLSYLRVGFTHSGWEMLPIFLQSCPNIKSVVVYKGSTSFMKNEKFCILPRRGCSLQSLEYVEIKGPLTRESMEMKLVSYFLENSPVLKKLTLCFKYSQREEESVILTEILTFPMLSTSCQVVLDFGHPDIPWSSC